MGGTALGVYAKQDSSYVIRDVEWDGMCVNGRGNLCARVRVWDSSVCIVSSRLSSGHNNVAQRCREYRELSEGLTFSDGGVLEQDYVFWAGDLNFRIDMSDRAIRERIIAQDYPGLLGHDQLRQEQRAGSAFPGFQEAPISFRPTSKCDVEKGEYVSVDTGRRPAWRDRILWNINNLDGNNII